MAKEPFTMVEATLKNDNGEDGVIQIRSTDVERMKKALGDRLKVKGGAQAKKAPPAKNKARSS